MFQCYWENWKGVIAKRLPNVTGDSWGAVNTLAGSRAKTPDIPVVRYLRPENS